VVDDESEEIQKNLNNLYLLIVTITALIFLMIFVVIRRLLPSLLILSSVAFSTIISFNFIYLFKIPMNMLTLGALALGFGMFVDNAIVVFENILRLRESGLDPVEAAIRGAREVFTPVLASTLTTIGVFFCFPFSRVACASIISSGHRHGYRPHYFTPGVLFFDPGPQPQTPFCQEEKTS